MCPTITQPQKFNIDPKIAGRARYRVCYGLDRIRVIRVNFGGIWDNTQNIPGKEKDKKRPNTIPVFGPGKWLLGESRALKVGINAGSIALPFKNR
jgi:hypothetical protein